MKSFYLLILLYILPVQISAQSRAFHFGVKLEFYTYTLQEGYSPKIHMAPIPSFHAQATQDLSESQPVAINFRLGMLFFPHPAIELGLSLYYKIPIHGTFLISGVNMDIFDGHASNSEIRDSKAVFFLVLGIGHQLTDKLSLDISFHQALNGTLGGYGYRPGPEKFFNMLKIGIAFVPYL